MKRRFLITFITVFSNLYVSISHGSNGVDEVLLDYELISIASGRPVPVSVSPSISKVISQRDIIDNGYTSISEALTKTPGIHSLRQGFSSFPVFSVRGFTSLFNVLFLVNGDPFDSAFYGAIAADIDKIPMELIDRIEVMFNPGGSIYGGNSTMGVVNILMNKEAVKTSGSVSYGSFDTAKVHLTSGFKKWGGSLNVGIDAFKTTGHELEVDTDLQTIFDNQSQQGPPISLAPTTVELNDKNIGLSLTFNRNDHQVFLRTAKTEDINTGVGVLPIVDKDGSLASEQTTLIYNFPIGELGTMDWSGTLSIKQRSFDFNDVHSFPDGAFGVFPEGVISFSENKDYLYNGGVVAQKKIFNNHSIRLEARAAWSKFEINSFKTNYEIQNGAFIPSDLQERERIPDSEDRTIYSFRLNDDWDISDEYHATIGIGVDDYSKFDTQFSPRIGIVWNKSYKTSLKLLYNRGSRIPSYFETIGFGVPLFVANGDVKPEQTDSIDLSISYRFTNYFTVVSNIFRHETNNLIDNVRQDTGVIKAVNAGEQVGSGLEIETIYEVPGKCTLRVMAQLHKNKVKLDDIPGTHDAGFSPKKRVGVEYSDRYFGYNYGVSVMHVGDQSRSVREPNKKELKDYQTVDLFIKREFSNGLKINLKINNLLDEDIVQGNFNENAPFDINLPGRNFLLTVGKEFL